MVRNTKADASIVTEIKEICTVPFEKTELKDS